MPRHHLFNSRSARASESERYGDYVTSAKLVEASEYGVIYSERQLTILLKFFRGRIGINLGDMRLIQGMHVLNSTAVFGTGLVIISQIPIRLY